MTLRLVSLVWFRDLAGLIGAVSPTYGAKDQNEPQKACHEQVDAS
jgi:hypothetical protein